MAMTDWISIKDRLPEPWVTVLLWDGDEMVSGYANYDGDLIEHRWGLVFRATHWMLPEPPDEEGEGMNYYAFKNRRNGKLLSGTDRRRFPYRQILSNEYRRPLLLCDLEIKTAMLVRRINPATYKVVKVRVVEVEE